MTAYAGTGRVGTGPPRECWAEPKIEYRAYQVYA